MTRVLYLVLISAFCIVTFCKNDYCQATEISPVFGVGQENFTFELNDFDPGDKRKTVKFEPNIAGITRLGVDAFGFGVGYSFRGSEKSTNPAFGKTQFDDWQLGYHAKNWGVETFYQVYTGFHTVNTAAIQVYPNLSFRHVGITARYSIGDEEFTVSGLMDQSVPVNSTSGKYYVLMGYDEHNFNTDTPLLQAENAGFNTGIENLRSLKSNDFKLGFGAGKYWLINDCFFFGGMFDVLATYANYKFESTTGKDTKSDVTGSYNARLAIGYKESNFRLGISLATDATVLKTPADTGVIKPSANKLLAYWRYFFDW